MIEVAGDTLLSIVKVLDSVNTEHRVQITDDHILIRNIDKDNVFMVEVFLNREECEYWNVIPQEIAINPAPMIEFLKLHKKDDVEISIKDKSVYFKVGDNSMSFPMPDINGVRKMSNAVILGNDPTWHNFVMTVKEFKDVLKCVGGKKDDHVRFVSFEDKLHIEGPSDSSYDVMGKLNVSNRQECCFTIGYLKKMMKGLENTTKMCFRYTTDKPLVITITGIKYNCEFLLAPRIVNE